MPSKNDKELARLAEHLGFASEDTLAKALETQRGLEKEGALVTLDRLLVEKGVLTPIQVEILLEKQGRKVVYCTGCTTKFNVFTVEGGSTVACRKCGTQIPVPVRLTQRPLLEEGVAPARPLAPSGEDGPDPLIGKTLGGYRIQERTASGGMGVVYRAQQLSLDRIVSLKVLPPHLTKDPTYVKRFLKEAKAAGRLQHPNIIQVYDIGEAEGTYYFSMEYVEGQSLAELLRTRSPLGIETAARIAIQIAKALSYAHRAEILHRDIRPETIMITEEGVAKLAELGFTKALDEQAVLGVAGGALENPFYLAPEQVTDSRKVGPPADLYSLGATLYRMVTGVRPLGGKNVVEVLSALLHEEPRPAEEVRPEIGDPLGALIRRAMAKRIEERFGNADELLAALRALDLNADSGRIPREERVPLSERLKEFTRRIRRRKN
ncbi:MAG: serine/threonine protein kinase [Planctomycetales bacterium]|nr:serine/threonine protein kinase [Planctomycetales bacterium]